MRIQYGHMFSTFQRVLTAEGFTKDRAQTCAEVFATNSLEGIYSHGVNRFAYFVQLVQEGMIDPTAEPTLTSANASLEQWNGNSGPGPLNALFATDRAMELAGANGIGCVALANTNHWMRAGYYGWKAARAGYAFIGWTNTIPLMPAWGATDSRLGNNPIVIAVPYPAAPAAPLASEASEPVVPGNPGTHPDLHQRAIVLDMAMSQFSYGKMGVHRLSGEPLPVPGGYDERGNLSTDAGEVLKTGRALPTGFWKGAGMSLLLDLLASVLTGGLATHELGRLPHEAQVSQVYLAFDLNRLSNSGTIGETIRGIIADYQASTPVEPGGGILYPGERMERVVCENRTQGIPVDDSVWEKIESLAAEA